MTFQRYKFYTFNLTPSRQKQILFHLQLILSSVVRKMVTGQIETIVGFRGKKHTTKIE